MMKEGNRKKDKRKTLQNSKKTTVAAVAKNDQFIQPKKQTNKQRKKNQNGVKKLFKKYIEP